MAFGAWGPNAMAAAIRNALELPGEARERVFRAAIENARRNYGWALMCECTLSVYDELFAESAAKATSRTPSGPR